MELLKRQTSNGSWGANRSCEETAYAILALIPLSSLPWAHSLVPQILTAIWKGREMLSQRESSWAQVLRSPSSITGG